MSVTNTAGEEIRLPPDPEAFRHRLETDWAADNPHRWKELAILTLLGNRWEVPNIARALGLNHRHVYRVLQKSRKRIRSYLGEDPESEESIP